MLLLDAFNKDRASLPQPLTNAPPLAPLPTSAPDPRVQEMINEKLKKAEDLGKVTVQLFKANMFYNVLCVMLYRGATTVIFHFYLRDSQFLLLRWLTSTYFH